MKKREEYECQIMAGRKVVHTPMNVRLLQDRRHTDEQQTLALVFSFVRPSRSRFPRDVIGGKDNGTNMAGNWILK